MGKVKSFLVINKKKLFLELASELFKASERCGLTEISHSLARDLHYHFSLIDTDKKRRIKYGEAVKRYREQLRQEEYIQGLFIEYSYLLKNKKDASHLYDEIKEINKIINGSDLFKLYKYSLLIKYLSKKNDCDGVIKNSIKGINYFKKSTFKLPYTTTWNFYRQLIPYLNFRK